MAIGVLAILASAVGTAMAIQSALSVFPPLGEGLRQSANRILPITNPQVAEAVEMLYRKIISHEQYIKILNEAGFSDNVGEAIFQSSQALLNAADYINLYRRKEIGQEAFYSKMEALHFDKDSIGMVLKASEFFPSANDLVRFAVRDVYAPAVVQKFRLKEGLPDAFVKESEKAGLPNEQAVNYWMAHWELPSAQQGFSMLHRRIITKDDMSKLLKSLDIVPFWRDALIKLSYNPMTRVDVRRMYAADIMDEKAVYEAYLDIGYSPENAVRMRDFAVHSSGADMQGMTRASLVKAFKSDVITSSQLSNYLKGLGYSRDVLEFWLSMAEHEKDMQELNSLKKEIIGQYHAGIITADQARAQLEAHDLPSWYIKKTVDDMQKAVSERVKLPSRTDLDRWLEEQLITEDNYHTRMKALGYSQSDIETYLSEKALSTDTGKTRYLGNSVYIRWLKKGIVTKERFITIMADKHISDRDVDNMLVEAGVS